MFGTIGHAKLKPGHEGQIEAMLEDWRRDVRPKVPGRFVEIHGRPVDQPGEIVFIALAQDERTYRDLANLPDQDAFFRRMMEHVDGDVRWEDVEMEVGVSE
ncbi:MAG: hypothetical protein ACRDJH_14480 [Thermomicrobiales bacterium]